MAAERRGSERGGRALCPASTPTPSRLLKSGKFVANFVPRRVGYRVETLYLSETHRQVGACPHFLASPKSDLEPLRLRHRNGLESAREKTNRVNTAVQHDVQTPPSLCSPSMGRKSSGDPLQTSHFKTCSIPLITHPYLVIMPIRVDGAHLMPSLLRFRPIYSRSRLHPQTHIRPHRSHPHPCLHRSEYRLEPLSPPLRRPGRLSHH